MACITLAMSPCPHRLHDTFFIPRIRRRCVTVSRCLWTVRDEDPFQFPGVAIRSTRRGTTFFIPRNRTRGTDDAIRKIIVRPCRLPSRQGPRSETGAISFHHFFHDVPNDPSEDPRFTLPPPCPWRKGMIINILVRNYIRIIKNQRKSY